jgi:hypothetical protein
MNRQSLIESGRKVFKGLGKKVWNLICKIDEKAAVLLLMKKYSYCSIIFFVLSGANSSLNNLFSHRCRLQG